MEDKVLEFQISGCIYTGNREVSLDDFLDEFIDFCNSKGWNYCGSAKPLEAE